MGEHLKTPEDITAYPYFPAGAKCIMAKVITPAVWDKCKDRKCKYGFSFKQTIFIGCKMPQLGFGVRVGSHESYYDFAPFMDRAIQNYHGHEPTDKHYSNMNPGDLKCPDFPPEEDAMINSTRIRVARNLAGYPMGTCVTKAQRLEIEAKLRQGLESLTGEHKGTYYSLSNLTEAQRKQLIDDHFLFVDGSPTLYEAGLERDWPEGRGIFHNDAKTFLCWINEEDQLRIISMQKGSNIREVFERLAAAADACEKICKFQHDDHLGYISTCPTNLGTGMRASVHIKLPKLMHDKEKMEFIANKYHV